MDNSDLEVREGLPEEQTVDQRQGSEGLSNADRTAGQGPGGSSQQVLFQATSKTRVGVGGVGGKTRGIRDRSRRVGSLNFIHRVVCKLEGFEQGHNVT